ncbi:MAG: hydroxymethylglutaryl-CoA lyase [Burkholderiaceae bacterium]|nr:hydroxymethylglutaryl-CoA lyase [Burkholderiaceae bacterium]
MPASVKIVDVSPRDGLQNEKQLVSVADKVALIHRLQQAGVPNIEAVSFVSPKWVPQMADGLAVMQSVQRKPGVIYSALTPNMRGYESAREAGMDEVVIFGAASEAFSQKNINCSIAESIERFQPVAQAAIADGVRLRASISCCLGCPYEGEISPEKVAEVVDRMVDLGCIEIDIADTIGVGTAGRVKRVYERIFTRHSPQMFSGHFHDTYGQAIANIVAALQCGISIFHGSVAGLGGCPYAQGASGNVATEDIVFLMQGLGIETGIDLTQLAQAGAEISRVLGRPSQSRAGSAWLARQAAQAS